MSWKYAYCGQLLLPFGGVGRQERDDGNGNVRVGFKTILFVLGKVTGFLYLVVAI
jgi:hypothetical protein